MGNQFTAATIKQPHRFTRTLGRALDGFKGAATRVLRAFRGR